MTIHKAKGLQFDTVIVPGLGAGAPPDERELFLWMERPRAGHGGGQTDLLLAPIHAAGGDKDAIHEYIRALDRRKGDLENGRVLYVAATRAKRRLHLMGDAKRGDATDPGALKGPKKGSLLAKLWPAAESAFRAACESPLAPRGRPAAASRTEGGILRVTRDFAVPAPPPGVTWRARAEPALAAEAIEFSWVGETARLAGTVVHRWLQRIAEDAMEGWDRNRVRELAPRLRAELQWRGVLAEDLDEATARVERALAQAITDAKGRWVLGPHPRAEVEYRLTAIIGAERRSLVIDRVFTDADGESWIVDYKAGAHEGTDPEAFLDRERERYAPQLRRYALALGGEPRLGLYFPLIPGWREVGR
jgi:ATP-dependent exoDNAse (exonuclease V) beta subunit